MYAWDGLECVLCSSNNWQEWKLMLWQSCFCPCIKHIPLCPLCSLGSGFHDRENTSCFILYSFLLYSKNVYKSYQSNMMGLYCIVNNSGFFFVLLLKFSFQCSLNVIKSLNWSSHFLSASWPRPLPFSCEVRRPVRWASLNASVQWNLDSRGMRINFMVGHSNNYLKGCYIFMDYRTKQLLIFEHYCRSKEQT